MSLKQRPSLRWLVIATVLSLMAFMSAFLIGDRGAGSFLVDTYVMVAQTVAPILTLVLIVILFARIGPQGSALQRNARAVCAVALFAIPYYFAAGIAVSGNAEIYANDRSIYATLVGTALLTAIVGFLPWRVRRSD